MASVACSAVAAVISACANDHWSVSSLRYRKLRSWSIALSSVAIAVAINLSGIAAGAACVGCCVQMIGFMIMSIRDNNIGKIISVGIGTSMLQFQNILNFIIKYN